MFATRASKRLAGAFQSRFHERRGSLPLSLYTFVGLSVVEPSGWRYVFAVIGSTCLYFWNSKQLREDEAVFDSWRWSQVATRGVSVFLMISACSIAPYLARSGRLIGLASRDLSLMASFVFATLIGLAVYLPQLLRPGDAEQRGRAEIRALELEHQACMAMFQAMVSALAALFLGAVFLPAIAAGPQKALLANPALSITWAFYSFGGCLVWLLRPCLARAKYIRYLLEMRQARGPESTG